MDAETPDNLPLSESWSTFNKQEKAVQLNSYKWGNIQLGENKEINGTLGIDKNCWGKKETTSPHPGKEHMQIVVSATGIRCEVGEHQCCQQDALKGLWGISAMAAVFWGWTQRSCGRSCDTSWANLHPSVRNSQSIDLELNKTILVWGLLMVSWMRHLLISQEPGPASAI